MSGTILQFPKPEGLSSDMSSKSAHYHSALPEDAKAISGVGATPDSHSPNTQPSYWHPALRGIMRWVDGAGVLVATLITGGIGRSLLTARQDEVLAVGDLVAVLVFFLASSRGRPSDLPHTALITRQLRALVPATILAAVAQGLVFWILGWTDPILIRTPLVWFVSATAALVVARSVGTVLLRHPAVERRFIRKLAVVGSDAHAFRIAERLAKESGKAFDVVGVFDDGPRAPDQKPVRGSIADLITLSRESTLHGIIVALPPAIDDPENQISRLSWRLRAVLADVYIMPYLVQGPDLALPVESLGPLSFMVLQRRPLTEWQILRKRMMDITLGLAAFVVLLPLLLVIACAIKLDSRGPILFRQPRLGFNNRQFTVFKFRSMYAHDADVMASRQTSRGDPRVTRVGKWLRRLSIDELPQLLNVLRGEMSLVGPRPHAPHTRAGGKLLDDALAEYVLRHQVKPGITGWAQVNGARGELVTTDDLRRRVAFDLQYIQRWSIRFDLKIMALTVLREVFSKNAF
jgi:Undecaprenyl-phosphate glucose phosphotransferase